MRIERIEKVEAVGINDFIVVAADQGCVDQVLVSRSVFVVARLPRAQPLLAPLLPFARLDPIAKAVMSVRCKSLPG
jgi:hypothetical protein